MFQVGDVICWGRGATYFAKLATKRGIELEGSNKNHRDDWIIIEVIGLFAPPPTIDEHNLYTALNINLQVNI